MTQINTETPPKKKRKGCYFVLFVFPLSFIFIIFLLLFAVAAFTYNQYQQWESSFEDVHLSSDFINPKSDDYDEEREVIDEKINTFSNSLDDVETITFSSDEALLIIGSELDEALPDGFSVDYVYSETERGKWLIYIKLDYQDHPLPWLIVQVEKEEYETADLYFSDIFVGQFSFYNYGLKQVIQDINDGYKDSLYKVNDGQFSGRRLENIELEDDEMIIKGRLNN